MDLKEIWRIVQKDIESECQDEISVGGFILPIDCY